MLYFNDRLADDIGLPIEGLDHATLANYLSGTQMPPGSRMIAMAYAGHQFGGFTMLGDGRAMLIGEWPVGDAVVDLQMKGSGPTPYSRRGDGLAAVGPMVRELVMGESLAALGVPTTRALSVVATGSPVYRQRLLDGAVMTRVAASHLRVGTFQFAAAIRHEHPGAISALADYAIARHDPVLAEESPPERYRGFFRRVASRQAELIADWQSIGFVHGVMNTDNMSIAGETIDFGPCAMMDGFRRDRVFSSIDHGGRYAYANQPGIAQWNLARLAESMLPLLDDQPQTAAEFANEVLEDFVDEYAAAYNARMRSKLGLQTSTPSDPALVETLLDHMERLQMDFTGTFDRLSTGEFDPSTDPELERWHRNWLDRITDEGETVDSARGRMLLRNPAVIARNANVESAIAAAESGDMRPTIDLIAALRQPFDRDAAPKYRTPPPSDAPRYITYCGT